MKEPKFQVGDHVRVAQNTNYTNQIGWTGYINLIDDTEGHFIYHMETGPKHIQHWYFDKDLELIDRKHHVTEPDFGLEELAVAEEIITQMG